MEEKMIAEASISINASRENVWKAITTPSLIKKYLMGTNVTSDWLQGSAIEYEGEYNGKTYRDKGVIQRIEPEQILQTTYWSSQGGKEDKPENYNLVTYKLLQKDNKTVVKLTQDNVNSENERKHVTENWKAVLKKLKDVVEHHSN